MGCLEHEKLIPSKKKLREDQKQKQLTPSGHMASLNYLPLKQKQIYQQDYLNPHNSLQICKICLKTIRKLTIILKCTHKFCLNCLMAILRGKPKRESEFPSCRIKILKT